MDANGLMGVHEAAKLGQQPVGIILWEMKEIAQDHGLELVFPRGLQAPCQLGEYGFGVGVPA